VRDEGSGESALGEVDIGSPPEGAPTNILSSVL